jgi:hypothetical protein
MDESMRKEIRLIFSEGVEDLIIPLFEEVRGEIVLIKEKLDDVDNRLVKLDRKFDVAMERMDEHSLVLRDYERRLTNLENP